MRLSEILTKKRTATATVATFATVAPESMPSVATVASVAVANSKVVKLETLKDRQREESRQKAIALMNASPDVPRGIYVDDQIDPDNVIVFVAVKACQQTCELLIPRAAYDPFKLLELIERQGQTNHKRKARHDNEEKISTAGDKVGNQNATEQRS